MKRVSLLIVISVAAFLLGAFVAADPQLDVNEKVTAGDILDAMMTVFIAIVIGILYNQTFSQSRVENDLLISHSKDVAADIRTAREQFLSAYSSAPSKERDREVIASTRVASNALESLEKCCKECRFTDPSLVEARNSFRKFRRALTDRYGVQNRAYTAQDYADAEKEYGAIRHALLRFALAVNKRS